MGREGDREGWEREGEREREGWERDEEGETEAYLATCTS